MSDDVKLVSYETLIAIGFSKERANKIWQDWQLRRTESRSQNLRNDGSRISFYEFFTAGLRDESKEPRGIDDKHWRESLDKYGISYEAQQAIMDPQFEYHRLSRSLRHWIKETIDIRYTWLQTQLEKARPSEKDKVPTTLPKRKVPAAVDGFLARLRRGPKPVKLFKAVNMDRASCLVDKKGNLKPITELRSPQPSDFSGCSEFLYFSQDYHVAEVAGEYARRRAPRSRFAIVSLTIPQHRIQMLEGYETLCAYWPSPRWKELIWRSRRGQTLLSSDYLRSFRVATLIIGTKPHQSNTVYDRMRSSEEITEECVYMVKGPDGLTTPAVQFAFSAQEGEEFLREYGKFRIERHL